MTRAEKACRASELRSRGLKLREIGAEMGGLSTSAVWDLLHDPDRTARREREAKSDRSFDGRGVCVDCGGPRGIGCKRYERCRACHLKFERAELKAVATAMERMWRDGASIKDIATTLGRSEGYVQGTIWRVRELGLADLPYRYSVERRKAMKR